MWPDVVVVRPPGFQLELSLLERREESGREALSSQGAVERLDESVIGRLARPTEMEGDLIPVRPMVERAGRELAAIVTANPCRQAAIRPDRAEHGRDLGPVKRPTGH